MDLAIVLTCVGTGITVIGFVYGFLRNFKTDIKSDISRLDTDMKNIRDDIKADMRSHTARTDKLYEMFVELQRENNNLIRSLLNQPKTNP